MKRNGTELIARAILETEDGQYVLCRVKGEDWFFLPGGHIELGEKAEDAIVRELIEELGIHHLKLKNLVGVFENFYKLDNKPKHEINLVFHVALKERIRNSREEHIEFVQCSKKEIAAAKILPDIIKTAIMDVTHFHQNVLNSEKT